jgi:hypothetical protein
MCGTMPKLIERQQFEQCMKGMKGMKGKKGKKMRDHQEGGPGSSEEQGAGAAGSSRGNNQDGNGPESDVAPGDGQLEAMKDGSRSGNKHSRNKREPRRGDSGCTIFEINFMFQSGMKKSGRSGKAGRGDHGGPGCFNVFYPINFLWSLL